MKFILSSLLVLFSFVASANDVTTVDTEKKATVELSIHGDRGRKKSKKTRRINKKRKRKCAKFGRKSFAG